MTHQSHLALTLAPTLTLTSKKQNDHLLTAGRPSHVTHPFRICLRPCVQVVDDNLDTDYGNENYAALDNNTVHMPIAGVIPAAGGAARGKKAGFRGLVRCVYA